MSPKVRAELIWIPEEHQRLIAWSASRWVEALASLRARTRSACRECAPTGLLPSREPAARSVVARHRGVVPLNRCGSIGPQLGLDIAGGGRLE